MLELVTMLTELAMAQAPDELADPSGSGTGADPSTGLVDNEGDGLDKGEVAGLAIGVFILGFGLLTLLNKCSPSTDADRKPDGGDAEAGLAAKKTTAL